MRRVKGTTPKLRHPFRITGMPTKRKGTLTVVDRKNVKKGKTPGAREQLERKFLLVIKEIGV